MRFRSIVEQLLSSCRNIHAMFSNFSDREMCSDASWDREEAPVEGDDGGGIQSIVCSDGACCLRNTLENENEDLYLGDFLLLLPLLHDGALGVLLLGATLPTRSEGGFFDPLTFKIPRIFLLLLFFCFDIMGSSCCSMVV